MTILTEAQIETMNYKECKAAMKALFNEHRMETPLTELTKEEFDLVDAVGNTYLMLEDRIARYEDVRIGSMQPNAPVAPVIKKVTDPAKAKRKARPYSMQGVIYKDIHEAALKTGIKLGTLRTYVQRKPDQYFYVD
jgi:hypothetical protein